MHLLGFLSFAGLVYASRFTPSTTEVECRDSGVAAARTWCVGKVVITVDIEASAPNSQTIQVGSLLANKQLTVKEVITSFLETFPEEMVQELGPISLVITVPVGKKSKVEEEKVDYHRYCSVFIRQGAMVNQPYGGELVRGFGSRHYYPSTFTQKSEDRPAQLIVPIQTASEIYHSLFNCFEDLHQ